MKFIGDVHAKFDWYYDLITPDSIQVGDLGIGFGVPKKTGYFIHGNHDDPTECENYDGYLGRWGYKKLGGYGIFFVSGALSIDRSRRTLGVDYWGNEELSYQEMSTMLDNYKGADIIVTHDCPASIYPRMGVPEGQRSFTAQTLDVLLEHTSKPKHWVFGHHHLSRDFWWQGINWYCLGELETLVL